MRAAFLVVMAIAMPARADVIEYTITYDKDRYEYGDKIRADVWVYNPGERIDRIESMDFGFAGRVDFTGTTQWSRYQLMTLGEVWFQAFPDRLTIRNTTINSGFGGRPDDPQTSLMYKAVDSLDDGAINGYGRTYVFGFEAYSLGSHASPDLRMFSDLQFLRSGPNGSSSIYSAEYVAISATVPEPSTLILCGVSVLGLLTWYLRRKPQPLPS